MTRKKHEASTTAAIKGASAPYGAPVRRKKSNPSAPYGEDELFESIIAEAEMNEEDVEEVVKKRGSVWVHHDDKTDAELGSYKDRDTAWEKQRQHRARKKREKERAGKTKQKKSPEPAPIGGKKVTKEAVMEHIMGMMKKVLNESAISYVFEQPQNSEESMAWDRFVGALSKESIMSDNRLKAILLGLEKSEMGLLNKAVKSVKSALEGSGFPVKNPKAVKDAANGEVAVNMVVELEENKKEVEVVVRVENGRPLIFLPDRTKNTINTLNNDESKLFRAELISVQEKELDLMDDLVKASDKRDNYLKNLEGKIDKMVRGLGPLEIAVMKNLLKNKYKNIR